MHTSRRINHKTASLYMARSNAIVTAIQENKGRGPRLLADWKSGECSCVFTRNGLRMVVTLFVG